VKLRDGTRVAAAPAAQAAPGAPAGH
jgi:hypothetical protein